MKPLPCGFCGGTAASGSAKCDARKQRARPRALAREPGRSAQRAHRGSQGAGGSRLGSGPVKQSRSSRRAECSTAGNRLKTADEPRRHNWASPMSSTPFMWSTSRTYHSDSSSMSAATGNGIVSRGAGGGPVARTEPAVLATGSSRDGAWWRRPGVNLPRHLLQWSTTPSTRRSACPSPSNSDHGGARGTLNGYQKGKCFYCFGTIEIISGHHDVCHVDHVFPWAPGSQVGDTAGGSCSRPSRPRWPLHHRDGNRLQQDPRREGHSTDHEHRASHR